MFKSGIYFVEPGHRALKFNKISGVGEAIYREGWNFKLPYFERAIVFDTRTHPRVISTVTGSKGKHHLTTLCRFVNGKLQDESVDQTRPKQTPRSLQIPWNGLRWSSPALSRQ